MTSPRLVDATTGSDARAEVFRECIALVETILAAHRTRADEPGA